MAHVLLYPFYKCKEENYKCCPLETGETQRTSYASMFWGFLIASIELGASKSPRMTNNKLSE